MSGDVAATQLGRFVDDFVVGAISQHPMGRTIGEADNTCPVQSSRETTSGDCVPGLFDRLSRDAQQWLLGIFPHDGHLIPLLMARQEMAGRVDALGPPAVLNSEFHVVRVGDSTFDLEAHLLDLSGRVVVRSTTVFAVAERATARNSTIPMWLARTLTRKGSYGGFYNSSEPIEAAG